MPIITRYPVMLHFLSAQLCCHRERNPIITWLESLTIMDVFVWLIISCIKTSVCYSNSSGALSTTIGYESDCKHMKEGSSRYWDGEWGRMAVSWWGGSQCEVCPGPGTGTSSRGVTESPPPPALYVGWIDASATQDSDSWCRQQVVNCQRNPTLYLKFIVFVWTVMFLTLSSQGNSLKTSAI